MKLLEFMLGTSEPVATKPADLTTYLYTQNTPLPDARFVGTYQNVPIYECDSLDEGEVRIVGNGPQTS